MVGEGAIIVTRMPFVGGLGRGTGASIVPIFKICRALEDLVNAYHYVWGCPGVSQGTDREVHGQAKGVWVLALGVIDSGLSVNWPLAPI